MSLLDAIILGIVEGITEFLPISSTGHLNLVEKLLGYKIDDVGMTAFTAVIQVGAILAAILYFGKDIIRIVAAWFAGLLNKDKRTDPDYTLGWGVILGSIPVAVVGLAFKSAIEGPLRSLWVIAGALIVWSFVMFAADRIAARNESAPAAHGAGRRTRGARARTMKDVTIVDALIIGCFQALSPLFPGISRSGATISAGLFRKFDRVTATRLSFFMGIPALVAAGALEAVTGAKDISDTVGWTPTLVATVVSFVVAYASIAWLLKFVSKNNFTSFIAYRIVLGLVVIGLVVGGAVSA